eukprot:gene24268-21169_t
MGAGELAPGEDPPTADAKEAQRALAELRQRKRSRSRSR